MAMTNIVINDGATTPVSHTFTGQVGQLLGNTFAVWYEKLASFSLNLWPSIKTRVQLSTDPAKDHVSQTQVRLPFGSVVDGAEVKQGEISGFVTVTCPYALNTNENMKKFWGLLKNALANPELTTVFVDQRPSN